VKSLYKTGLHDTPSALLKKDALTEISSGANISFNINNLRVGLTWSENRYSLPLINESNELKDIYSFTGKNNSLLSVDYKWLYKNMIFFGEYTFNPAGGTGFLQGIKLRPDNRLAINLLFNHYDHGFRTLHGSSPVSGSQSNNETGIMANLIYEAGKNFFISAGADFQYFPWLRYRCNAPSWGKKHELKTGYYPSDNLSFEILYNFRDLMINSSENVKIKKPEIINSRSIKTIVKYTPEAGMNLRTRIEYKILAPSGKRGLALSQDVNFVLKRLPVRLWLRWCLFDTDNYDSRIYVYENDMVNSFSIPSLYDEGSRSYLMIAWKILKKTELRVKYGISTINGNSGNTTNREEFKFQLRISV
jgi:hypothetical protein